jgi:hypothetical protein
VDWTRHRRRFGCHYWIHYLGHGSSEDRLARRVHSGTGCQRFHDWLCVHNCYHSNPRPNGNHWLQVNHRLFYSIGRGLTDATSTRDPAYQVIINTLKNLGGTKLDAAWGITGLVSLYAIRYFCIWGTKRYPARGMSSPFTYWIHGLIDVQPAGSSS